MLSIHTPLKFQAERVYIIDLLFGEFLGLKYEVEFKDIKEYEVHLGEKVLKINDAFFGIYEDYLQEEVVPQNVEFLDDLPVIYGENRIDSEYLGLDIFGSAFFMLSRFEEFVIKERDEYGRFPSSASLAVKCGFEKRAVVNGYVELLWKLFLDLGYRGGRKEREYKVIYTHDVDHLRFWKDFGFLAKRVGKCIFKYRNFPQAFKEIGGYLSVKLGAAKDPYDVFDRLMEISEKAGGKSIFYFLVGKDHEYDADFSPRELKSILEKVKKRGHEVALHPSFLSYKDGAMIQKEIVALEMLSAQKIEHSRQHFLRIEVPTTWRILEECGIKQDSTLGYSDRVGFRCGCCRPFPVFDFLNKRCLDLVESPLIAMDGALLKEADTPEKAKALLESLKAEVRKYEGEFVILWHNSSFGERWAGYDTLYENLN